MSDIASSGVSGNKAKASRTGNISASTKGSEAKRKEKFKKIAKVIKDINDNKNNLFSKLKGATRKVDSGNILASLIRPETMSYSSNVTDSLVKLSDTKSTKKIKNKKIVEKTKKRQKKKTLEKCPLNEKRKRRSGKKITKKNNSRRNNRILREIKKKS